MTLEQENEKLRELLKEIQKTEKNYVILGKIDEALAKPPQQKNDTLAEPQPETVIHTTVNEEIMSRLESLEINCRDILAVQEIHRDKIDDLKKRIEKNDEEICEINEGLGDDSSKLIIIETRLNRLEQQVESISKIAKEAFEEKVKENDNG